MKGVTLIELVVTIVILGILSGIAAVILVPAYEAYFAAQRRSQVADVADVAVRRLVRDVRIGLPNSVRVGGTNRIEILLTRNGGRYRSLNDSNGTTTEDTLDFSFGDTVFDVYQPLLLSQIPAEQQVQLNDYAVIHNLGITGADAYNFTGNTNIKRITGFDFVSGATGITKESRITLANTPPATRYPLESPGRRYFVVSGPVTYACLNAGTTGGNGDGTLIRWSEYTYDPDHPTITTELANSGSPPASRPPGPLAGNLAVEAVLASNVSACEFTYTNNIAQQSRGLVSIRLAITRANETVVLYQQAHVNNVP